MDIEGWAAALESSPLGEWMRSDPLAYPIVNVVHLLGLVLLVGPILLLDLRLLGAARHFALMPVSALLTKWAATGLVLSIGTGVLLFSADAGPLIANPVMQIKLLCILAGIANAVAFRVVWRDRVERWDSNAPRLGHLQAALSIALWLTVGTLGRWIAYS